MEKKKKIIIVGIAALLLFSFAARGLGMRGAMGYRGWGSHGLNSRASVFMGTGDTFAASKDFEALGLVFAESSASRRNGYGMTHEALVREAAGMGADAIINVSIAPTSGVFNRTWTGSALAIRYQN